MGAALRFDVPDDPQSVEMLELLSTTGAADFVTRVTGLEAEHPLFAAVVAEAERVERAQQ
jgi:mannitol-1-phosphate 5-dehydrogenase